MRLERDDRVDQFASPTSDMEDPLALEFDVKMTGTSRTSCLLVQLTSGPAGGAAFGNP